MVQFCLHIETVFCCLLQQMTRIDIDWNLKNLGQFLQVLMLLANTTKKIIIINAPCWNLFEMFFKMQQEKFTDY